MVRSASEIGALLRMQVCRWENVRHIYRRLAQPSCSAKCL